MIFVATGEASAGKIAIVNYENRYRVGGNAALMEAERFLMGESEVQKTLARIAGKLDELSIPYAVVGGMALVAHGYNRTTVDVDILVTSDDLRRIHQALDGLGYLPPFAGNKHLRDTTTNVRIGFLTSGNFPGDGKPKPVSFPSPADAEPLEIDGIKYIGLTKLLELKLASGMTGGVGRLKDLADVVELIRTLELAPEAAERLNPFVAEKFRELAVGVANDIVDHGSLPDSA